jgi:LysM repeat protein
MPHQIIQSNRQIDRVAKRKAKLFRRCVTLCFVLFALLAVPRVVHMVTGDEPRVVLTHTVERGDTLWDIAAQYSQGVDPRKVITAIKKANQLSSATVHPGQVLAIPHLASR